MNYERLVALRRKDGFMKKIISFTLALVILLSASLSMSSCSSFVSSVMGDGGSGSGGSGEGGGQSEGGGQGGGTSGTETEGGENGGETLPETFYPGISDIDFTNLNASTRSLLSSVAITSHFAKYNYDYDYGYDYGYGYGGSGTTTEYVQYGSGVIYKIDREAGSAYIVTNFHVVYHRDSSTSDHISTDIKVYLYGQEPSVDSTMKSYPITATFIKHLLLV